VDGELASHADVEGPRTGGHPYGIQSCRPASLLATRIYRYQWVPAGLIRNKKAAKLFFKTHGRAEGNEKNICNHDIFIQNIQLIAVCPFLENINHFPSQNKSTFPTKRF
jgi:hypothetical protein